MVKFYLEAENVAQLQELLAAIIGPALAETVAIEKATADLKTLGEQLASAQAANPAPTT